MLWQWKHDRVSDVQGEARREDTLENLQVLDVATREIIVGDDQNPAIGVRLDGDGIPEIARATFNFDLLLKELFKCGNIKDLVVGGGGCVDGECLGLLCSLATFLGLEWTRKLTLAYCFTPSPKFKSLWHPLTIAQDCYASPNFRPCLR